MRLLTVLLVLALAAPCFGASACWELIHTPSAATWDVKYTADAEPPSADPAWTLYNTDKATASGGVLTIDDAMNDLAFYYRYGAALTPAAGSSLWVYTRVKTEFGVTDLGYVISAYTEDCYVKTYINNASLKVAGSTHTGLDTYTDFVEIVIRVGADNSFEVWLDGESIATGTATATSGESTVIFGGQREAETTVGAAYYDTVAYCVIVDAAEVPPAGGLTGGVYANSYTVVPGTSPKAYLNTCTVVAGTSPKAYVNTYEVP